MNSCANMIHKTIMFYRDIMEVYWPYSTFVEEDIRPQHSFTFSNVIFVALWHSSKASDSVHHDKVLDIMVIT